MNLLVNFGYFFVNQGTQSEVEKHESEWTAHMDIFLKNALQNGTITQVSFNAI